VPRPSSTWFDPARRSKAQASRDGHPIRTRRSGFPPFASLVDAGRLQLLQPHATPIQRIRSVALLVPPRVKSSPLDTRRGAPSSTAATARPRPILAFVRLIDACATTKRAEPSRIFCFFTSILRLFLSFFNFGLLICFATFRTVPAFLHSIAAWPALAFFVLRTCLCTAFRRVLFVRVATCAIATL
jgi:hypothetical protein